ncbi:carbohydrate-binding protein [Streptomyces globosus]|uniref:Carbohydrate-binding protein n=1 Tax=Streptomyces globosus TaxID=68209 RepID=A0A344U7N4_9ACTN|nr:MULTISPECIES: CBM35 domain-containing protein [Streptomyces]AXE26905.1 carbohydrate-binding protein [Streptomyces globosus]
MTTPANNGPNGGANKPEDDDPFGYLYADGQAAGASPPPPGGGYSYPGPTVGGQPGVPRTSYNQVRTVGERTYGGQRAVPQQQPPGYQAQYQAPETLQAGGYAPPQQPTTAMPPQGGGSGGRSARGGGRGGSSSSRRGMLIAAVAVVAAVAIGIGAALTFGDTGDKNTADKGGTQNQPQPPQPQNSGGSEAPSPSASPDVQLPKGDAAGAGMALTGGALLQNAVPGGKGAGGQYVGNFNQTGAALTWTADIANGGDYTLFVNYAVPGKDAKVTLTVNGQTPTQSLNLANFAKADAGAWDKGWTRTYAFIKLNKGTNTMKISCEAGNQCEAIFDQLSLGHGWGKR